MSTELQVYGIRNCDSVRLALKFFKAKGIGFTFHDFDKEPAGCETVAAWLQKVPMETLLNNRSATYRKLGLAKMELDDAAEREWLCKENRLIKRPVVVTAGGDVIVGFDEEMYAKRFSA